jgi:hypothetical protein
LESGCCWAREQKLEPDPHQDQSADHPNHAQGNYEQAQQQVAEDQKEKHQQQCIKAGFACHPALFGGVFVLQQTQEYRNGLKWIDDCQQRGEHA